VSLAPLSCPSCGGAVPLGRLATVACPYCAATVEVPAAWRAAVDARAAEDRVRAEVEPRWRSLSRPPPRLEALAAALLFALPPAATALVQATRWPPLSPLASLLAVALPAVLPGALLWLWLAALRATLLGFRLELAARPPATAGGPVACRGCGAPLSVEGDALAATCAYCGADSLVVDLPPSAASEERARSALHTLAEAVSALGRRRALLVVGLGAILLVVGGLAALAGLALGLAL
jgi:uncharacterized Zn finger protein (UPF0148 family)